jgi:hypothetical protein
MELAQGAADGVVVTGAEQASQEVPAGLAQAKRRPGHTGGKKGARKPSKLLMDMRWCYQNKPVPDETLTPGRAQCRILQKEDPVEFLKMLRDLEKALAGLRRPGPEQAAGGPSKSPGSDDRGEQTTRELIDKLMGEFK